MCEPELAHLTIGNRKTGDSLLCDLAAQEGEAVCLDLM